jgi:anti-sigma factor RsiW
MSDHLSAETLIDYLHGELDPGSDSLVHQHVAACGACAGELDRERALGDALRSAAALDERELPPMLKARIWEAVRAEAPRPRLVGWVSTLLRPFVALPLAAAAAAAFAFYFAGPLSPSAHGAPAIEASYYIERHEAQQLQNPLAERSMPAPTIEAGYEAPAQGETPDLASEAATAPGTLDVVR